MEKDRIYTGYKDCAGKCIFLDDIIHDTHYVGRGKRDHYYKVVSIDGKYGMVRLKDGSFTKFEDYLFTSESVIGSIHDNPNLLK